MQINQLLPSEIKRKNQDKILQEPSSIPSGFKNFIGMTLKEYIHSIDNIPLIEENQEQSIDSLINLPQATPLHPPQQQNQQKPQTQKQKLKSKHKQELLAIVHNILRLNQPRIPIINLKQLASFDKNQNKLPIIHKQRSRSSSRNQFSKQDCHSTKKQRCLTLKNEEFEPINYANTTINKHSKNTKINSIYKQTVEMKKISNSKIIHTSFFKEKTKIKIKTEFDSGNRLQNPFLITRYRQNSLIKRKQNVLRKS